MSVDESKRKMVKRGAPQRLTREHGQVNRLFLEEERTMLAGVDKAKQVGNPQIIGANGEKPLLAFFSRYLPAILRPVSGKFITPSGALSPQIDLMIMDSRYPLLCENSDGSVLIMLHSLIQTVEVKTCVRKRDISAMIKAAKIIKRLSTEVFPKNVCRTVATAAIAYRSGMSTNALERNFFGYDSGNYNHLELTVWRLNESKERRAVGAFLRREEAPEDDRDPEDPAWPGRWKPEFIKTFAPLSDFYYDLVRRGYDTLDSRAFSLRDISEHMMSYMVWGTCPGK